jgi:hypothetical protein
MNLSRKLRRAAAAAYLKEIHGIDRTPGTLAKYAVVGGGPRYQLAGRIPLYPEIELDKWAESILSPLKSSTSDRGGDHAK